MHGSVIEVDKNILFLKHKSSQKPQLRRNPTVLNDVQIQSNAQHSPEVYHQQNHKESTIPTLHWSNHAAELRKKSRSAETRFNYNCQPWQDETEVLPQ